MIAVDTGLSKLIIKNLKVIFSVNTVNISALVNPFNK